MKNIDNQVNYMRYCASGRLCTKFVRSSGANKVPVDSVGSEWARNILAGWAVLVFAVLQLLSIKSNAQSMEQLRQLQEFADRSARSFVQKKQGAIVKAYERNIPVVKQLPNGGMMELMSFDGDRPVYYATTGLLPSNPTAITVSTNQLHPGGVYNLTGQGEVLGQWDGGRFRLGCPGVGDRVTVKDDSNSGSYINHASEVASVMMSNNPSNVFMYPSLSGAATYYGIGMAYEANVDYYDWNNDISEMANAAASGLNVANLSYGHVLGWENSQWYGAINISTDEDYMFGFYSSYTADYDKVAYDAPYFLIVRAAGNDRDDSGDGSHPKDGGISGFDCIPDDNTAKNLLLVGADSINLNGYTKPGDVQMSDFSSWGPTDDGRIKPDLVAPGVDIGVPFYYSGGWIKSYSYGTSIAAPVVTGSIGLLLQHERDLYGQVVYRSSTMKALLIHTADEAGPADGPDYKFGWGQVNFLKAAQLMDKDAGSCIYIREYTLHEGQVLRIPLVSVRGENQKVTICWTDPPGTPVAAALDPPDHMLVNDLDLRLKLSGKSIHETFYPWVLDKDNPSAAATQGDNTVDNVEQVDLQTSGADGYFSKKYIAEISHKGTLTGGSQVVSVIVSGFAPTGNSTFIGTIPQDNYLGLSRKDKTYCSTKITSNAKIAIGRDVDFMSPGPITLKPGFKVEQGAYFSAMVSDELSCDSPGTFTLKSARIGGGTQQTPSGLVYERNVVPNALRKPSPEITVTPGTSPGQFHMGFNGNLPRFVSAFKVSTGLVVYSSDNIGEGMDVDLSADGKGEYRLMVLYEKDMVNRTLIIEQ